MNDLRFLRLLYFVFKAVNIFLFGTKKCSAGVIDTIRALCVSPPFAIFLQKHSSAFYSQQSISVSLAESARKFTSHLHPQIHQVA